MTRSEQVKVCKTCINKASSRENGIICGLTNAVPTYTESCADYKIIPHLALEENDLPIISREAAIQVVKNASNWLYAIAGLTLINSITVLIESDYGFILGLGITQVSEAILFEIIGELRFEIFIPSLIFCGMFAGFGYYASRFSKNALLLGLILYCLDSLIFLFVEDWVGFAFHIWAITGIWKGYNQLKKPEPALKFEEIYE